MAEMTRREYWTEAEIEFGRRHPYLLQDHTSVPGTRQPRRNKASPPEQFAQDIGEKKNLMSVSFS